VKERCESASLFLLINVFSVKNEIEGFFANVINIRVGRGL
jgi:hypothetical protein